MPALVTGNGYEFMSNTIMRVKVFWLKMSEIEPFSCFFQVNQAAHLMMNKYSFYRNYTP